MKNYNRKEQKKRGVKPAKVVIWGMITPNSDEEEEERDASPGSRQPSCHDSSRMDSVMAAGITRHHHHDMPNRVQAPEEEEEEQVDASGGDDSLASGRERLKRHRTEVGGRVWIPEIWGHEEFLKDLVDCTVFDSSLVPSKIMSARAALVEEARRASSPVLGVGNRH